MDMPMNLDRESRSIQPQSRAALLAGVPHDKKWALLKDLLEPLFHTHKVKDIARIMKEQHGFSANEPSYRYHFKQWGWTKSVSSLTKNHILHRAQARAMQGKSTSAVVAGRKVDGKRLKRQAKANARQEYTILDSSSRLVEHQSQVFGRFLPFGNKMSWRPLSFDKNYADEP
ncbi:uncharacterized protein Z518_07112 [Rhinocladiella mackenziei CBS 650.93]|uniref:Rhinocladiella mackenziei CBS 650.93 unplaced genomic scaffold supercont1.5, whole genome shotgun sequence n=1 Tax=Rhinocladiella mackenziei CBS 650.93 TaxID=1442369 RepID=A0A0D2ICJ9_9EURO|nr:uncharacterized protein Z518_07112 [Rhinocladiella mackenziei CBS 650.93]KIX03559.1 hypothetical protein Z518_07112 [Rhinocladiella mackenziei CBS 650.93]